MADSRETAGSPGRPGVADWRRLVEKSLKGRDFSVLQSQTRDGIVIDPVYPPGRRPVAPGHRPLPWSIVQVVDDCDPDRANDQAVEDLAGGATGLALRFADAASPAEPGLALTAEAIGSVLAGVDLSAIHLRVEPHREGPETALRLRDFVLRSGYAPERLDFSFGLDPVGLTALWGTDADLDPERFVACFQELRAASFQGALAELDTRVFHEAGASEAQELAAALVAASWWLRALDDVGISPETALPFFGATVAVDRDQFLSIAKLRALRLLWARLQELCGAQSASLPVHAQTSRRMMTGADPYTNVLRTTIAAFAAAAGGADSLTVLSHNATLGLADRHGRSLARNIQNLLMAESHLHRVADPAAGSGAVEALTDALAERSWVEFQAIEREGGIFESLRAGLFQERIATGREALRAEVANGAAPLVGATIYAEAGSDLRVPPPLAAPPGALFPTRLETLVQAAC